MQNRRVMILTALICLGIVIACAIAGSTYYSRVTVPIGLTQELGQTQVAATETSLSLLAADSASQTQQAMPTFTPLPSPTLVPTSAPQSTICDAEVAGTTRNIYPIPGQGNISSSKLIIAGSVVKVLGRLEDNGWYKIEYNNDIGWMKSDSLQILNICKPTIFDLHYLANWLDQNESLILDDTFSANANIWINAATSENILVSTTQKGESVLNIKSSDETIITTTNPRVFDVSSFKLYTSFATDQVSEQSYFGIRFRDSGSEYFQVSFLPSSCKIDIFATNKLIYSNKLNPKTCIDRYYDLYLSLSDDYKLEIQINGFDPITVNLQDPDGRYSSGKIDLAANKIELNLDYIVITAPK